MKWKTVEEIQPLIDAYFKDTPKKEWTITGLALELDTSRKTLMDYEWNDEFSNTIKKAKEKVEYSYELDLKERGNTGTIFALKNFDWTDKSELDTRNLNVNATRDFSDMSDEELLAIITKQ